MEMHDVAGGVAGADKDMNGDDGRPGAPTTFIHDPPSARRDHYKIGSHSDGLFSVTDASWAGAISLRDWRDSNGGAGSKEASLYEKSSPFGQRSIWTGSLELEVTELRTNPKSGGGTDHINYYPGSI